MSLPRFDISPTPAALTTTVERIARECQPHAIIAFGSRARGQAHADSDVDLFVLLDEPVPDRFKLMVKLRALLADLRFAKDILVNDLASFDRERRGINNVHWEIAEAGVSLYETGSLNHASISEICHHPSR